MSLKNGFLAIALMSGLSLVACSNTAAGVEKDAKRKRRQGSRRGRQGEDKASAAGGDGSRGGHEGSGA